MKLSLFLFPFLSCYYAHQEHTDTLRYSKLADWDDGEPSGLPDSGSRWDKVVVLKHMFTLKEIGVCAKLIHPGVNISLTIAVGGSSCDPRHKRRYSRGVLQAG